MLVRVSVKLPLATWTCTIRLEHLLHFNYNSTYFSFIHAPNSGLVCGDSQLGGVKLDLCRTRTDGNPLSLTSSGEDS